MKHLSTRVRVVIILAVLLTGGLAVLSSATGQSLPDMLMQAVMAPVKGAANALTKRSDPVLKKVVEVAVMDKSQFAWIVVFLCLSAACCIIAGAVSVSRSRKLAAYNASLEEKAA